MWKTLYVWVLGTLWLSLVCGLPAEYDVQDPGQYMNSFLVQVSSRDVAEQVARDHGFQLRGKLPELDYYFFSHVEVSSRSKRSAKDYVNQLKEDSRVGFVEQEITLKRVKRTHQVLHDKQKEFPIEKQLDNSKYYRVKTMYESRGSNDLTYNDRFFDDEWYLENRGQTGGKPNVDLNVRQCWEMGYTGNGVVVSILDDGMDHKHIDLRKNYDRNASADFNDRSDIHNDPSPNMENPGNDHGTRCAGEIAAEANNGICSVGIAYDVNIGGIRLLDGPITTGLEAEALNYKYDYIDIYSASWGPMDDGCTMEGFKQASIDALIKGVTEGRNGLGNIFVWATGNGGDNGDHCGADGYVSSIYSISIQSMSDKGELPFFGERCSSTMAAVPSGGEPTREEELKAVDKIKVVTTDIHGGCIENFMGTSSAAPLGSGCIALVLQAAPHLSWRDVQHLVAKYSRIPGPDEGWIINGASYHINSKFGFGLLDCAAMADGGQKWTNVPPQHTCATKTVTVNSNIPHSGCHKVSINFDGCEDDDNHITHLEHVEVQLEIESPRRGDVEIFLTSPAGTRSELLGRRINDDSDEGINFTFMTVHSWMENPKGLWSLEVCNNPGETIEARKFNKGSKSSYNGGGDSSAGKVKKFKMMAYGYYRDEGNVMQKAFVPDSKYLKDLAHKEFKNSRQVDLKRANLDTKKKKQYDDETDQALADLRELFNGIANAVGGTSNYNKRKEKTYSTKKSYQNDIHNRGQAEDEEKFAATDVEIERAVDEILAELRGQDLSTVNIRDVLKRKKDQMMRERKRRILISQLKRFLA